MTQEYNMVHGGGVIVLVARPINISEGMKCGGRVAMNIKTLVLSTIQISEQAFQGKLMIRSWGFHELRESVDSKGDVGPGEC